MIPLENKTNVVAPNLTYPFGDVIDNNGTGNGTPVNRMLLSDTFQFFEALMFYAGITPNNQLDNGSSSNQLIQALAAYIGNQAASQGVVNAGTDTKKQVTAATLAGWFNQAWVVPGTSPAVVGYTDGNVALTSALDTYKFFKYRMLGKNFTYSVSFSITCSGGGNWVAVRIPLPAGVTCKGNTFAAATVVGADGTSYPAIIQAPDGEAYIKVISATTGAFSQSYNLISTAEITFEIN